jgi:hypothetical protein
VAEDRARWRHERAEADAHAKQLSHELDDAIDAGDAGLRRLRHRLDDYGSRLAGVRRTLCAT